MPVAIREAPAVSRQPTKFPRAALAAALGLAALALRLVHLGSKSLWLDETYRIYLASMGWHDFLRAVVRPFGTNSVVYHFVLRYWLLLGSSEAAVRALSVVFGLATVAGVYKLGIELFDYPTALLAAALAATNALLIRYSQEVCAYTLAALLAVLSSLYLFRALKDDKRGNWLRYALTAILMLYCHVLSMLVVVAHALAVVLARKRALTTRTVLAFLAVAAAFVPLAWSIVAVPPHPLVWLTPPGLRDLEEALADFAGPLGYLFVFFALFSVKYAWREQMTVNSRAWRYMFLLSWAAVPPALLFLLSQWKPLFLSRYLVPSVPPLLLLVAAVVRQLKSRRLIVFLVVAMLAVSVRNSIIYLQARTDFRESYDWRDATAYLANQARPGDAVVFYFHHERFPFQYYRDRLGANAFPAQVFPAGSNEALLEESYPIAGPADIPAFVSSRRIWLVYSDALAATKYGSSGALRDFRGRLAHRLPLLSEQHFGYIHLTLFASPGARP